MSQPTPPKPKPLAPPTIDPVAAKRWATRPIAQSAWLHEEVHQRMAERLQWMRQRPQHWLHWHPMRGGIAGHQQLQAQLPDSTAYLLETHSQQAPFTLTALEQASPTPWWKKWMTSTRQVKVHSRPPPTKSMDMVWANMHLHTDDDPMGTLKAWRQWLKIDGVLMFSCLGPDSLLELRQLYDALGWAPPCSQFTDMHDWGDMLIAAGYAEPVMDVERVKLSYQSLDVLLRDLRAWGRNLHPARASRVAPKAWQRKLSDAFHQASQKSAQPGPFELTLEIIYGHAVQSPPQIPLADSSTISLDDMRSLLAQKKPR